jgi:hypothetical protein
MRKNIEPRYDPLHPIECLQSHLKEVVLQSYSGHEEEVDFARFFVLNAEVLSKIEVQANSSYNREPFIDMLQVENKASRDIQFEFRHYNFWPDYLLKEHIHDLSVSDPFRQP